MISSLSRASTAETVARFCPDGHHPDAGPGELCERCGLYVPIPPEPTAQERLSADFCPNGHTEPKTNGACARCGATITPPMPGNW